MDTNEANPAEEALLEEDLFPLEQEEFVADEMLEEAEEDDDEKSDSFTGMSAAEKKKHLVEYLNLIKEIEGQNKIVEELKGQLLEACENPCLTTCQLREIKKIRTCMENENLKLQCTLQKVIAMQNEIPTRYWDEVPIVTTIEDDVFPSMENYDFMTSLGLKPRETVSNKRHKSSNKSKKKKIRSTEQEALDTDSCKFFEEMSMKDRLIKRLSCKLKALQREVQFAKQKEKKQVENNFEYMKNANVLKADLRCPFKEEASKPKGTPKKSNEFQKLKENYVQLLRCIGQKDAEIKKLTTRVKGYCDGDSNTEKFHIDQVELKLLREKVADMQDEQEEYKCIIKEQSEQLDDYRRKYMDSQQKVEEQKSTLTKMDLNNKRIEGKVEAEVKRIKAKFKEQLSELSQYPKLLENEQIKLANISHERDNLEEQLKMVCKELKSLKDTTTSRVEKPDCSQKLASCENELILLKNKIEDLSREKEIVSEEMLNAKFDLDTLRAESVKIITNTKERFEMTRKSMNSRIDTLEKELAQCRANACLSVTDREAVIKEMQTQLSTLSYSFDSAQSQIKTLKNHISFLSNDQCIPIKY